MWSLAEAVLVDEATRDARVCIGSVCDAKATGVLRAATVETMCPLVETACPCGDYVPTKLKQACSIPRGMRLLRI